jgi:hypothetical protein
LNLRHVPVLGTHALGEAALQLLDGIAEINLAERRGFLERAVAGRGKGMTTATVLLQDGLPVGGGGRIRRAPIKYSCSR